MKTKNIVICALFAAIIAVLAQISMPLPGGVPLTMQTLGVGLCGILLGAKKGGISVLIYVLMGAIGIPVFASLSGGLGVVFGPTGGFILSFPIMAFIIGYVSKKTNNKVIIFLGIILSVLVNYTLGTIQFSVITGESFFKGIMVCVVPFVITDILKSFLIVFIGSLLKNHKGLKGILNYDKA